MRVLIVDDEPDARRRLAVMLAELDVLVVGEAANGAEALDLARERLPDVLLLDVVMPGVDGLDVARHLRHLPPPRPLVIFQTGHGEYAVEAFRQEAVDYVMKPVMPEQLAEALDRARRRLTAERRPEMEMTYEMLARLREGMGGTARKPRLLVREGVRERLVWMREVARFTADNHEVWAIGPFGRRLVDYTLGDLEERGAGSFISVSRSDLVNLEAVLELVPFGDGSGKVRLKDGTEIAVNRRRMAAVRQAVEG